VKGYRGREIEIWGREGPTINKLNKKLGAKGKILTVDEKATRNKFFTKTVSNNKDIHLKNTGAALERSAAYGLLGSLNRLMVHQTSLLALPCSLKRDIVNKMKKK
jgi:hypothetical protein